MRKLTAGGCGLAVALLTSSALALADGQRGTGGGGPQGGPAGRIEQMREHLDLTDEQVSQLEAIRDSGATRREKREQMRAVLTEAQREQILIGRSMHRDRGHRRPHDMELPDDEGTN